VNLKQMLIKADAISLESMACGNPSAEAAHIINQVLRRVIEKLKLENKEEGG